MDWRQLRPSADGTHHTLEGRACYERRFDEVLAYHEPGLAPVRLGSEAWHIDARGSAAYARRFRRAFGFYEGRAAIVDEQGWHHILPDGTDLYPERYAWCGNYQGQRCAVRDARGLYLYLTPEGRPTGPLRWRYAGDYREAIAVVQDDSGLCTHVDMQGAPIHGQRFLDLDVFHKGFARAKDTRGWTHVDRRGRAVSERRFAMVEPFYNGQARVERFDGGLEVIDEAGQTVVELRPASSPHASRWTVRPGPRHSRVALAAPGVQSARSLPEDVAMTISTEDRFNTEVIKLLLQVAWSDRQLTQAEHLVVFGLGRSWNVPELELQSLLGKLKAGGALPEPDMEILRTRPDDVIEAARALSVSDGHIAKREKELIATIQERLGLPKS